MKKIHQYDRQAIYERDGHKCLKCQSSANLTIDHVIPISKGGEYHIRNYQTLCRKCNNEKGAERTDYRWNDWVDHDAWDLALRKSASLHKRRVDQIEQANKTTIQAHANASDPIAGVYTGPPVQYTYRSDGRVIATVLNKRQRRLRANPIQFFHHAPGDFERICE